MANKNKRMKYLKKNDQSEETSGKIKPVYIIGIVSLMLVAGTFFLFSAVGINIFNVFPGSKKNTAVSDRNSSGLDEKRILEPGVSNSIDDESGTVSDVKDKSDENVGQKSDNFITISLSDITRQGKYYTYTSGNNIEIKYFALMDKEGKPHIAIDACDVCYRSKKGYALQGDQAICRNCGNSYPVAAIGTENKYGGCWPSYLPVEIVGNELRIPVEGLKEKEFMFS
jgi:hypothetical protein